MKKNYLLLFLFSFFTWHAVAQDFDYGKISGDDIELKNTVLDSSANAMVIREFGTASMRIDDAYGRLFIDYQYHVKIKIFNKQGFKYGNIVIPTWFYDDDLDQITDLKAITSNFTDGVLVKTELDKKKVFIEKKNKYVSLTKFTMPNLAEGSIIEYSYRLRRPGIFNFKSWEFQSDIPKLHSEYIAFIPALYNYNVTLRGSRKLTSQDAKLNLRCLTINGLAMNCSEMTYIMKDVPALVEEKYMTAPGNFRSAIYFELSDYILTNGGKINVTKTWKDINDRLLSSGSFGAQMKKKNLFKEQMPEILSHTTDELSKAKAVYDYIKKNIRSNGFEGMFSESSVKTALETHSGNTGDINLALIAALSAAGLDVEAVVLSTRANGTVNPLYPVISDFDYVVAKVNINNNSYLLDASVPLLPFGLLPLQCMNGQGRVINLNKPSYWYDITASQRETTRYNLDAEFSADGKINGKLTIFSTGYAALRKRVKISASSSLDEYVEHLDEQIPDFNILKHKIENLDSLDNHLVEVYEIETTAANNMNNQQLYFNPFFINRIVKNPFNLNERTYPVDLGVTSEERVNISIKLPDGFKLADQPKNTGISLQNQGGRYLTNTTLEGNTLIFNELILLNKPIYSSEEYLSLKEFFSRIIQLQKIDIVLKK